MFPLQQRNFYNYVMENKEVMKTLSLLTSCTQEMRDVSGSLFFGGTKHCWRKFQLPYCIIRMVTIQWVTCDHNHWTAIKL